jgi:alginate O-acetyltransferase complex protein AlgI
MLFSSFLFLLLFLPLAVLCYFLCSRFGQMWGILSVVVLSCLFYSWHHPMALFLVLGSILLNFVAAKGILNNKHAKIIYISALGANVLLLIVFKYLDFLIGNINMLCHVDLPFQHLPLPLAISFFTFQQIAFLVDVYKRRGELPNLLHYSSFILFFPQLIAGPIVKHTDYLPQIQKTKTFSPSLPNLSIGSTLFIVGLFKKTCLADSAGFYADRVFNLASQGVTPNTLEAWIGVLSYTFQIYFDFSGYSDMAIGLARMFNIHLPINFFAPYKSASIIEFWRRWHISLSNFLKEHIYIPLGGNKRGTLMRYQNLMVTMLIGGLWHGASWTFVLWGGLHGLYLIINHILRQLRRTRDKIREGFTMLLFKRASLFLLVSITWVFFRAKTLAEAKLMLTPLFQLKHLILPMNYIRMGTKLGWDLTRFQGKFHLNSDERNPACVLLICLAILTFFAPTVHEWMGYFLPSKDFTHSEMMQRRYFKYICWKPNWFFAVFVVILFVIAFGNINATQEFIYFQF